MSAAYPRILDALRKQGCTVRESGDDRAMAQCPAHDDRNPSLSITDTESRILVHCHAGCDTAAVLAALGLTMADLYDQPRGATLATYIYPGDRRVHRKAGKTFPQSGNTKTDRSLFHADRIGDAKVVFVVEGEEDVFAIESAGAVAVCPAMGAGKAHLADWSVLDGRHVIVVADADEPGRKHATQIDELLRDVAATVSLLESAPGFKDVSEHLAAGKLLGELVPLSPLNGQTGGQPPSDERPRLWLATDLKPAADVRWLAKGRLPRGATSLLVGDEGIGKSLLWVWVVAAITTGKPLPEFGIPARAAEHVVLVLTEDDWSATVRPRLEVAGADLSKIAVVCEASDGSGAPEFPRDMALLENIEAQPVLIVIDAWLDTVSSGLSVRDPQQARQALHPWKDLATRTDAAVLLLTHTNRVSSANPRDRYGATGELRKKARMTLFAQTDEDGRLVVGPEKSNLVGPINATAFTIEPVQHFAVTDESDGTVPRLVYAGESDRTAKDLLADSADGADEPGGNPARAFLFDLLMRNGGELSASDALKAGRAAGFGDQELKDARRRSKPRIESRKASFGGGWVWAIATDRAIGSPQGSQDGEGSAEGVVSLSAPSWPSSPPSGSAAPSLSAVSDAVAEQVSGRIWQTNCARCGIPLERPDSIERGRCAECLLAGPNEGDE